MSIWSKLLGFKQTDETNHKVDKDTASLSTDTSRYTFVDVEIGLQDHKIHDIGAVRFDGAIFHKASKEELFDFLRDSDYLCGHNIIHLMMPNICLPAALAAGHWSIRYMYLLYYSPNARITDW